VKSNTFAKTAAGLMLFVLLVVGGPYSFLIYNACQPSGVGGFFSDVAAFHSQEGC
jgi:hypothetical protein